MHATRGCRGTVRIHRLLPAAIMCGILLLAGCDPPYRGCSIVGAWFSGNDYLFVPHRDTDCVATSNLQALRGGLYNTPTSASGIEVHDGQGHMLALIDPDLEASGFDTLYVTLRTGEQRMFVRETVQGRTLAESIGTYAEGHGNTVWEFSDGGWRLMKLYYLGLLLFVIVFPVASTAIRYWDDHEPGPVVSGVVVYALLPVAAGVVCGLGHYAIYGWWDARLAGKYFVGATIPLPALALTAFLIYLVLAVRGFKDLHVAATSMTLRRVLFWVLILSDGVSLVVNVQFLYHLAVS